MKSRRYSIVGLLVSLLAAALLPIVFVSSVQGAPSGTILGTIRDSNGSVVTGATVMALHIETNQSRSAVTDGNGDYIIASLPIGTYRITVTMTGFKQAIVPKVILQVDQKARIDFGLEVGEIANQVTIEGTAPVVDTESSSVGQVIDNKKIVDLPLNGRDFTQLAALTPGVLTTQTTGQVGEQTGFTMVQAGGGGSNKTEFLLDGITNQEQLFDGVQYRPSVDTLQEFRVLENSFSAEYGRGSAIINATTKAGTNSFHGSLYEFLRNDHLDARNFFAQDKPINKQNQFGGTIGGPVKVPGLFDGKNSTFFFYGFEGLRIRRGLTRNTPVPSQAFRDGDFSSLGTPIIDPLTGAAFTGNQIPANRISDTSKFLLGFVPAPNNAGGTYQYSASSINDYNQNSIRVDRQIGKGNLYVRYSITDQSRVSPGSLPTSGTVYQETRTQNVVASYNYIFNPALLNEVRLGYGRLYNANTPQGLGTNVTVQAGIRGFDQTSINFPGFPNINVTGFGGLINGVAFAPIINPTNTWNITDNLTIIDGRHNIKIGADLRRFHLTSTNAAFSRGNFNYSGVYSGNGFADFLLDYPASGTRDFPRNLFGLTDNQYHFYIQDDFKIAPKLTLFLGLRYEYNTLPTADDDQAGRFDPALGKVVVSTLPNGQINLISQQVASIVYPTFSDVIVTAQDANQ
ncbi:MAG: carboxypeptidase regulatory-like domain-containing protein, partial [Blastocatellia bacterium]|nr:carboxypeptidase regulatory-like domain-containing protein [Blastocatellia bacterium]